MKPWRVPAFALLAVAWLTMPLTAGAALPSLLRGASAPGKVASWTMAGIAYGAGVMALLRPGGGALAVLRLAATGALVWVGVPGVGALDAAPGGALLGLLVLVAGLAWSAPVAQASADASAYPGERRFALAMPPGLQWVVGPLAAAVTVSGVVAPVLLGAGALGSSRPLAAVLVGVPGVLVAFVGAGATMRLARRWLVLVPSGVVLHDPALLHDTYRLSPDEVGAVALTAPGWRRRLASSGVLDATGGASKALWIGLTTAMGAPGTRPGVRRPDGPVEHIFCAPWRRGEAALALNEKGYAVSDPVGAP